MSTRRPPRSDDGGADPHDDDPTPPRGSATHDDDGWDDWDEPNYLLRRVVTVGSAVLIIGALGFVAARVLGGDSDSSAGDPSARWNSVVVITDSGAVVLDRDGSDELTSLRGESLDSTSVVAGGTLVSLTDTGQVTQTDVDDGSVERGRAARDATLRISPDNPTVALIDEPGGGDVTIVDTVNRDLVSIAEAADLDDPLIFARDVRVNASGSHVAAPVPNLFQSFVVDLDTRSSTALAGRVLAISDDRVVTEQPAGSSSELEFYDLGGDRIGSVDVEAPAASMLLDDGSMLIVSADGDVSSASADGVESIGRIVDPEGRRIEITESAVVDDRLLVIGAATVYVLDTDGTQIGSIDGRLATDPTRGSRCAVVASGTGDVGVEVLDTDDGEIVGQVERGLAVATSVDGCTVAVGGGPMPRLIADGEVREIEGDSIVGVAPDGSAWVVVDGRRTLLDRGDDEPVELADEPSLIRFAQR